MNKKIKFKTKEERDAAIRDNAGMRLIKEANHKDGRYLVFTDVPIPLTTTQRMSDLEERLNILENHPSIKGGN